MSRLVQYPPKQYVSLLFACLILSMMDPSKAHAQVEVASDLKPVHISNWTRTLSGEDISAMGFTRLGDILSRLPGINSHSTDNYTNRLFIFGSPLPSSGNPTVYVDGRRQPFSMLGLAQYNLIPVIVAEIDSLSYSGQSFGEESLHAQSGRIDIWTRKRSGSFVQIGAFGVNEINDPGPYRYTEFTSPNVDRSGPALNMVASTRTEKWYSRLLVRRDEHHVTDQKIAGRVPLIYDGRDSPRLLLDAVDFFATRSDSLGTHSFQLGASQFQDFLFRRSVGFEIPLNQEWFYTSAKGHVPVGIGWQVLYSVGLRSSTATERKNSFPFGSKLIREQTDGAIAIARTQAHSTLTGRIGLTTTKYHNGTGRGVANGVYEERTVPVLQFLGTWRENNTAHQVSVSLSSSAIDKTQRAKLNLSTSWSIRWDLNDRASTFFGVAYTRTDQPSSESYLDIVTSEIPIPVFEHLYSSVETIRTATSTQLGARIGAQLSVSNRLQVHLQGIVRSYSKLIYPATVVDLELQSAYQFPSFSWNSDASGTAFGLSTTIDYEPSDTHRIKILYSWSGTLDSSRENFGDYFVGASGHRLWFQSWLNINSRFRLYSLIRFIERSDWPAYTPSRLANTKSAIVWDVSLQKKLWSRFLVLGAGISNLTNTEYVSHPSGGIEDLMLHVNLQFTFSEDDE